MSVRAILWQHLAQYGPRAAAADDPNALLPSRDFIAALQGLPEETQARVGRDYAKLWARTFRSLVRHMRGEPERGLSLWVDDVLPYLCGRRIVGRIEQHAGHSTRILLDVDLPRSYLAGMAAGFAALAGCEASAHHDGDALIVEHRLRPTHRASRAMRHLAKLRIPLLMTSVLAACVGIAMTHQVSLVAWDVLAVLVGTFAAQAGANALHDLRPAPHHALAQPKAVRSWLIAQAAGSYLVAGAALAWLLPGRGFLLAYAALGLLLSRGYSLAKQSGRGPWIAAASHGPLIVWGSAYAVAGPSLLATPAAALLATLPTGMMAAAMLLLDDLADRPLEQAAGNRSLVLRRSDPRDVPRLAAFIGVSVLALALAAPPSLLHWALIALAAALGATIVDLVRRHRDDPARLAAARSMMLAAYAVTAAAFALNLLESA